MTERTQITMDRALQRRAQDRATQLGISFAEYVRRVVASDLGERPRRAQVAAVFDLVVGGPATDITRNKDKMVAEAVWRQHRRKRVRRAQASPAVANPRKKTR